VQQLAREADAEDEPDGLVVFGELLDDFFRLVKKQMGKMLKMR
jgi:hypothetical protein